MTVGLHEDDKGSEKRSHLKRGARSQVEGKNIKKRHESCVQISEELSGRRNN